MYQVLYRKWRPRRFEDVVGQEHVTRTLKNGVKLSQIAHAYLFIGSRGTGKTSCAKIFSMAVNCLSPVDGSPCTKCRICKEALNDSLLDISEIDAASNNGVENIRAIKEEAYLVPSACKYRVYIIDEVHMLSNQAFNAFLKVLEEPPKHVIFILATTEPHKIPLTISSRCQRFEFFRINNESIVGRLRYICGEEKIEIDEKSATIIANASDGAMRDALSLLDRCVSFAGRSLSSDKVENILGITDKESVLTIFEAIKNKDVESVLENVENLHKRSKSMLGLCEGLLEEFRKNLIRAISEKRCDEEVNFLLFGLDLLASANKNMSSTSKSNLEIALINLCFWDKGLKGSSFSENESANSKSYPESRAKNQDEEIKRSEVKKNLPANKNDEVVEFSKWHSVIDFVERNAKSKTFSLAMRGSRGYIDKNFILIDSEKDFLLEMLKDLNNKEEIKKAVFSLTGKEYNIGFYKKEKDECKCRNIDEFAKKVKRFGVDVNFV